jgi:single-strand DNA-binding protein
MISNNVTFIGRLGNDIELRTAGETSVASFSLAHDRRSRNSDNTATDWVNFTAFGATAEFLAKYFHKGNRVAIQGHLQVNEFDSKKFVDSNGVPAKLRDVVVVVDNAEFVEPRAADGSTVTSAPAARTYTNSTHAPVDNASDLPF